MTPTVHVVEPGGRGGVYQHAASLAAAVAARGVPVVLHTASDADELPAIASGIPRSACLWRSRSLRPPPVRKAAVVGSWLLIGVPTCLASVRPGDVVQVEGWFRPLLLLPVVLGARLRGARVVLVPHNTFSRKGHSGEEQVVRWMSRRADAVLAFSERDRRRIETWGATSVRVPMMFGALPVDLGRVARWRARWGAADGQRVVLLAGQLRTDKGLDLLVRAAAQWGERLVAALVGEDLGALAPARRLAAELDVPLRIAEGYQPIEEFVAALYAADVVVCPYRVASQSAVLTLARAWGLRTVATDIGGLAELATVVVPPDDPLALAYGVERSLRHDRRPPPPPPDIASYLEAYGLDALMSRDP